MTDVSGQPKKRKDSGWAPYWAPMLAFLLAVELGGRLPELMQPLVFVLKVIAPLGFFVFFLRRGAYPELYGADWSGGRWLADVAVGLLGAAVWVAPYLLFDSLRPDIEGFDPAQFGEEGVGFVLAVRAVGYSGVTPFVEELFVRSWLIRYIEVFDRRGDFRKLPIGRFRWRSFHRTESGCARRPPPPTPAWDTSAGTDRPSGCGPVADHPAPSAPVPRYVASTTPGRRPGTHTWHP